jgi:hypothetical protein
VGEALSVGTSLGEGLGWGLSVGVTVGGAVMVGSEVEGAWLTDGPTLGTPLGAELMVGLLLTLGV